MTGTIYLHLDRSTPIESIPLGLEPAVAREWNVEIKVGEIQLVLFFDHPETIERLALAAADALRRTRGSLGLAKAIDQGRRPS